MDTENAVCVCFVCVSSVLKRKEILIYAYTMDGS